MSKATSRASSRLDEYKSRSLQARKVERDRVAEIVQVLGNRAYHIPGNSYFQDWKQYFFNNHPVIGICFSHPLHPMTTCNRLVMLVGSLCCGLAITNFVYLWFLNYVDGGLEEEFISIDVDLGTNNTGWSAGRQPATHTSVSITNHQIFLWTVGGAFHSIFDLSVWFISACVCCLPGGSLEFCGRFKWMGSYMVVFTVLVVAAAASLAVVLRASMDSNLSGQRISSAGIFDDNIHLEDANGANFNFLISWLIEVALALFVYNPIIGTIFFSGVLGCGKLPFLGGRPREIKLEERATLKAAATEREDEWGRP